jgi:SAM-dependent methyltransferase
VEAVVYDQHAALEQTHWWFQGRRHILAAVLRERLGAHSSGREILDVGSGTGEMLDMLSEFGAVRGLDISSKAIAYCRDRFGNTVDVRLGGIPDDLVTADVITAFDVIEHVEDDVQALRRIRAHLPSGGVFVCTVPAFEFIWSDHDEVNHHRRRYRRRGLRQRLESAGFEVEQLTYFNTLLFPAVVVIRLLRHRTGGIPQSDMAALPGWVNRFLFHLFSFERRLLCRWSLPFGVSLLAVCTPAAIDR